MGEQLQQQQLQQHKLLTVENTFHHQQQLPPSETETETETEAQELELSSDFDAFPHSDECVAILTMKCGEPLMAVRKKLCDEIVVSFIPEEGFGVFQSKVERHYRKLGKSFVQDKRAIYLKPSSNATQTKYVQLNESNFDPLLRMRWKIARTMKVDLKYEVFAYFVDTTATLKSHKKQRMSTKLFQPQENVTATSVALSQPLHMLQQQQQPAAIAMHSDMSNTSAAHVAPVYVHNFAPAVAQLGTQPYADVHPAANGSNNNSNNNVHSTGGAPATRLSSTINTNTNTNIYDHDTTDRPRKHVRLGISNRNNNSNNNAPPPTAAADAHVWRLIPFRINGFVVPLEVDVAALQRSLRLEPSAAAAAAATHAAAGNCMGMAADTDLHAMYDRST